MKSKDFLLNTPQRQGGLKRPGSLNPLPPLSQENAFTPARGQMGMVNPYQNHAGLGSRGMVTNNPQESMNVPQMPYAAHPQNSVNSTELVPYDQQAAQK